MGVQFLARAYYDRADLDYEFLAVWLFDDWRDCAYTLLYSLGFDSKLFSRNFKPKKSGNEYGIFFWSYYSSIVEFKMVAGYIINFRIMAIKIFKKTAFLLAIIIFGGLGGIIADRYLFPYLSSTKLFSRYAFLKKSTEK